MVCDKLIQCSCFETSRNRDVPRAYHDDSIQHDCQIAGNHRMIVSIVILHTWLYATRTTENGNLSVSMTLASRCLRYLVIAHFLDWAVFQNHHQAIRLAIRHSERSYSMLSLKVDLTFLIWQRRTWVLVAPLSKLHINELLRSSQGS